MKVAQGEEDSFFLEEVLKVAFQNGQFPLSQEEVSIQMVIWQQYELLLIGFLAARSSCCFLNHYLMTETHVSPLLSNFQKHDWKDQKNSHSCSN
jgi:ABC-type Fe2+-enterobactin transport system substrate-binding protein